MKNPLLFLAPLLALASGYGEMPPLTDLRGRKRGKKGGGKGGAGVTLRKFALTRPPPGYWQQQTPLKHLHSTARLRAITT